MSPSHSKKRRITLDLDAGILSGVDELASLVKESRNTFIATAIVSRLRAERRARTDAEFARIAGDGEYREMLLEEERCWAPASDAAWRIIDQERPHGEGARQPVKRSRAKERRAPR